MIIEFKKDKRLEPAMGNSYFDEIVCACEYRGIVRDALKRFKFYNKPAYFRAFTMLLLQRIREVADLGEIDIIVSVPLHPIRKRRRGYNQSYLISKALSKALGIKEQSRSFVRVRNTRSQSLLKRHERLTNMEGAFKVKHILSMKDKTILLVDDILTTGTTLNEFSKVLKQAGAKKIIAAVIASGRRF